MYGELRIITAQAILDWLESARNKIEREKAKKDEEAKKEGEENKENTDSYYDEEEGEDQMQISDELMQKFLDEISKYEKDLKGALADGDANDEEGDEEYYDEEEGEAY